MAIVKDLLRSKGNQVWVVAPDATVQAALELMSEKNVGALVVIAAGEVVGIFSERDYANGAVMEDKFALNFPVRNLMSSPVYGVTLNETVENCLTLMTEKRFRHLPVIDNGSLVGLVSIGDLVKHSLSEKEKAIKDLEDYIWVHMI
jgi:CBS domain-containing protein